MNYPNVFRKATLVLTMLGFFITKHHANPVLFSGLRVSEENTYVLIKKDPSIEGTWVKVGEKFENYEIILYARSIKSILLGVENDVLIIKQTAIKLPDQKNSKDSKRAAEIWLADQKAGIDLMTFSKPYDEKYEFRLPEKEKNIFIISVKTPLKEEVSLTYRKQFKAT